LFAQYAAASYCTNNVNSTGDGLSCLEGNCPSVQSAETTTLYEFDEYVSSLDLYTEYMGITDNDRSTEFGDVAGFLAADQTNNLLVLSFRGSRTISTWIANIDFGLTDASDLCTSCEVHSGFWKSWETVADDLTAKIKTALTTYSGYKLVLTGHSFGAAVATLGGTALRNAGYELELVSATDRHEHCHNPSR
jgi:triacylglycerol lipase